MTLMAFNFCELPLWMVGLSWLLPFLLGLLLGYALWHHWKKKTENLEKDIKGLKGDISQLEEDLKICRQKGTDFESQIAMLKGQMRERDLSISTLESSLTAAKKKADDDAKAHEEALEAAKSKKSESKGKSSKKGEDAIKAASLADDTDDLSGGSSAAGIAGAAVSGLAASGKSKPKDDLQKIEGIGPKIEGILNDDKIRTYKKLADSKVGKLRKILDAAGPRYRTAKPDTWPEQAALARDGKWDELNSLQDILIGGLRPDASGSVTKISSGSAKDNLKKVEGIGPKIEGLLNADGIMTFAALASSEVSNIKRILDEAGPRYRIAVPDTWPEQAALARDGKWDELEKLQDSLKGGRKT